MSSHDRDPGRDEVELYTGASVTVSPGDLWVAVAEDDRGTLQIDSAMRVRELSNDAISMGPVQEGEDPHEYPLGEFHEAAGNGELFPMGYFLDNRSTIREEMTGGGRAPIPDMVMDVWGEYLEFQKYGPEYVSYLIEGDIREIRGEMQDQDELDKEFADIAINAIRALEEFGSASASELIQWRLEGRMAGDQEEIIKRYTEMWTGHIGDPSEYKR